MIGSIQTDLSPAAKAAFEAAKAAFEGIEKLDTEDQFAVIQKLLADLSATANRVPPTKGKKMDSTLSVGVAASNRVENATHGFSIVHEADGSNAVKFIRTLEDGTIATYLLSAGAKGVGLDDLAQYGEEKLKGAELKPHSELVKFVEQYLNPAIEGLPERGGVLQTNDEALKLAHSLLQLGVRTANSNAYVVFDTENSGRVHVFRWSGYDFQRLCAFFGASSPESNN
jgi:hypothetical protein